MRGKNAISSIRGKKTQQLNQREVKLINKRAVEGMLLFDIESKNSGTILHYDIEGLVTVADFLNVNPMTRRLFVVLLRHVVLALKEISKNHFNNSLVVWSLNSCYIDPTTWRVYLMYVPLQPYENDSSLKNFLLDFAANCTFETNESAEYVQSLVAEINSAVSYTVNMLEVFCNRISGDLIVANADGVRSTRCPSCKMSLREEETICPFCNQIVKSVPKKPQEISSKNINDRSLSSQVYVNDIVDRDIDAVNEQSSILVNEDENGVVTVFRKAQNSDKSVWIEDRDCAGKILIKKFPFRIGRMAGVTDYRVYDNAVSRKHVDILKEEGKFFVVDLGSKNGTLLNGKRIQPGVKEELFDGTFLKLADKEFKLHID